MQKIIILSGFICFLGISSISYAQSASFEFNYDVLEKTAVKQNYIAHKTNISPVLMEKKQKKLSPTKVVRPFLTSPNSLRNEEIIVETKKIDGNQRKLLTAPFVSMNPVSTVEEGNQNKVKTQVPDISGSLEKTSKHKFVSALPTRKPSIQQVVSAKQVATIEPSSGMSFVKIPYPTKKPLILASNKTEVIGYHVKAQKNVPIKTKKVPVTEVIATNLVVPDLPTSSFTKKADEVSEHYKQILFHGDGSIVTNEMQIMLDDIKLEMENNKSVRVQLHAFATGENGDSSSARRISLSRALSVREYLKEQGVRVTRMDVRALGSNTTKDPMDRVDFVFMK